MMNRNELHPDLSRNYDESLDSINSGVEQVNHPRCHNMWFVIPPPPPRSLPENLPVKSITESMAILAQQPDLSDANQLDHLISYLFLRKEAVESSRMEGTLSTIDHVLTPGELFDDWKTKSEGASVRGYAYALEEELERVKVEGYSIFTTYLVSRLHKKTMALDPKFKGVPGRIREPGKPGEIVWIRGQTQRPEDSIYNPTPAHHVLRCLQNTMKWYADSKFAELGNAGMGMPLVARMAIGHAHFEAIHPFSDGNGRVGRMLMTLQMANQGKLPIYLSGYIEEEKLQYSESLQEAQKKLNYAPIIEFIALAIIESQKETLITKECIQSLPADWKTRGTFRKGSTAERAFHWLIVNPIFTVKQLQKKLCVSLQAANTAVHLLQKYQIIRERTGFERNRVFAAEEVISLLSRRFGSDPQEALEGARIKLE